MVKLDYHPDFTKLFLKLDNALREKVFNQLTKIRNDPEIGKPMRYIRKGTRELYIKPFRLSYVYKKEEDKVILLELYHKDEQ